MSFFTLASGECSFGLISSLMSTRIGSRGSDALCCFIGAFLFGLTAARTPAQINALTCMASLMENAFYGVLYAYAPEVSPGWSF